MISSDGPRIKTHSHIEWEVTNVSRRWGRWSPHRVKRTGSLEYVFLACFGKDTQRKLIQLSARFDRNSKCCFKFLHGFQIQIPRFRSRNWGSWPEFKLKKVSLSEATRMLSNPRHPWIFKSRHFCTCPDAGMWISIRFYIGCRPSQ